MAKKRVAQPKVEEHVSVAVPVAAQEVLSDPKATPEERKAAMATAVVTPDPDHAPTPFHFTVIEPARITVTVTCDRCGWSNALTHSGPVSEDDAPARAAAIYERHLCGAAK